MQSSLHHFDVSDIHLVKALLLHVGQSKLRALDLSNLAFDIFDLINLLLNKIRQRQFVNCWRGHFISLKIRISGGDWPLRGLANLLCRRLRHVCEEHVQTLDVRTI